MADGDAEWVAAGAAVLGDGDAGVVGVGEFCGDGWVFAGQATVAGKMVEVYKPFAGEDAFVADVAAGLLAHVDEQLIFYGVVGGKGAVAPFGGHGLVALAIEVEERFAQPGTGGNDGDMLLGVDGVMGWGVEADALLGCGGDGGGAAGDQVIGEDDGGVVELV